MYSTLSTLLNASLTALSKHSVTRPADWVTPCFRQVWRKRREVYSLPRSLGKITHLTSPPRVATAKCRAATISSSSWSSPIA